jgi:hypothetical protein
MLLSSASIAWLGGSAAIHAITKPSQVVTPSSTGNAQNAQQPAATPLPEAADAPVRLLASSAPLQQPPLVVDARRKNRVPSLAPVRAVSADERTRSTLARTAKPPLEPPARPATPSASDAENWLERQK